MGSQNTRSTYVVPVPNFKRRFNRRNLHEVAQGLCRDRAILGDFEHHGFTVFTGDKKKTEIHLMGEKKQEKIVEETLQYAQKKMVYLVVTTAVILLARLGSPWSNASTVTSLLPPN